MFGIPTTPGVLTTNDFSFSNCVGAPAFGTGLSMVQNVNNVSSPAQVWFSLYVTINNVQNQQTLPWISWEAEDASLWLTVISLSQLRIQEVNKDSIGVNPI